MDDTSSWCNWIPAPKSLSIRLISACRRQARPFPRSIFGQLVMGDQIEKRTALQAGVNCRSDRRSTDESTTSGTFGCSSMAGSLTWPCPSSGRPFLSSARTI